MTESVDRERFESAVKIITGLPKDGKKLKFHYTSAYVTVNAEGNCVMKLKAIKIG